MIKLICIKSGEFMTYLPKVYGTCMGASFALNLIDTIYNIEIKKDKPKKIVVYKQLLHNKTVMEDLSKKNIEIIEDLEKLDKNSIVILRTHGESKKTYEFLEKNNIEYYDATCKKVADIHKIISEKYNQNYDIIIIGNKNDDNTLHSEVEGSNGWCDEKAIIISHESEIKNINFKNKKVLIICQSTFNTTKAVEIAELLKKEYVNIDFEFVNSICNIQSIIQREAVNLAKNCDYMIVLGGKNSSNTKELYNKCSSECQSYHCQNLKEVLPIIKKLSISSKIGITGGASTPKYEIEDCKNLIDFYQYYIKEKQIFEKEIENYNLKNIDKENNIIYDAIKKFNAINNGGKFLRAMLISLGYKMFGGNDEEYIPLAISYETFQTSILIHDDIIDEATIRRGKETIPTTYLNEFKNKKKSIANSLGICIGDLGFYFANQIIIENLKNNENVIDIFDYYNKIVINTIKGEILDVKLPYETKYENKEQIKESNVMDIYRLKTAWYTIIGPFCLGAILAGKKEKIDDFYEVLKNIGIAFQIKDDIIGIFGNELEIGKSTNSDITENKQTILYSYVYENCPEYYQKLDKIYGNKKITAQEIEEVKEIFIKSKALDYSNNIMNTLFENSKQKIKEMKLKGEYEKIILGFIEYLKIREK